MSELHPTDQPETLSQRRALVSGASIAGLCTAFWLARTGWAVTVVERSPAFRDGGQNVDVRGAARQVLARMGLEAQVRAATTTEEGTSFVDSTGRVIGAFPVEEADGPTAELEILRGDLARVVLDALPDGVDVRYGTTIGQVTQLEDQVQVELRSGTEHSTGRFDLLVIAEGVRSTTRALAFGAGVTRRELGLNMAYGTIPRQADDDRWWRWYTAPGRRQVTLRPDNVGTTRATLAYVDGDTDLSALPLDEARGLLRTVFTGAGWQADRVVAGFEASADVYVDYLTQIQMDTWSVGRVVVTGDAAWCVTPLGGGGTSLAMTGAYVLAAYLSQPADEAGGTAEALRGYEAWMRPLITDTQKLPPGTPKLFYPKTRAGVRVQQTGARLMSTGPLRKVFSRISHVATTTQTLPDMHPTAFLTGTPPIATAPASPTTGGASVPAPSAGQARPAAGDRR